MQQRKSLRPVRVGRNNRSGVGMDTPGISSSSPTLQLPEGGNEDFKASHASRHPGIYLRNGRRQKTQLCSRCCDSGMEKSTMFLSFGEMPNQRAGSTANGQARQAVHGRQVSRHKAGSTPGWKGGAQQSLNWALGVPGHLQDDFLQVMDLARLVIERWGFSKDCI